MTKYYEFIWVTLTDTWTEHSYNNGGFRLSRGCENMGFGTITFFLDKQNQLVCDNERMDKDFIEQGMSFFIRQSTFCN